LNFNYSAFKEENRKVTKLTTQIQQQVLYKYVFLLLMSFDLQELSLGIEELFLRIFFKKG